VKGDERDTPFGQAIELVMEWLVFLPLTLGSRSKIPVLRVAYVVLQLVWALPAMAIAIVPLTVCMFVDIFIQAWRGDL
jgi:hypothetical protein